MGRLGAVLPPLGCPRLPTLGTRPQDIGQDPLGPAVGPLGILLVPVPGSGAGSLSDRTSARSPPGPAAVWRPSVAVADGLDTEVNTERGRAVPRLSAAGQRAGSTADHRGTDPRSGDAGDAGADPSAGADRTRTGRAVVRGSTGRPSTLAAVAPGVASRSQRQVPLSVVGRVPVDLAGIDRRASPGRHQPRSAHRTLLNHDPPSCLAAVTPTVVRTPRDCVHTVSGGW